MADEPTLSLWHATLAPGDALTPRPALQGPLDVDVAIVGAGYTGLWTAHYLHESDPTLRIAVLEREVAGFGASGRNGGWCSALLPMSLDTISRHHGRDAAIRLQRAMFATVDEVGRTAAALGIDCHFAKGGTLQFARNPAQLPRLDAALAEFARYGLADDLRWLPADEAAAEANVSDVLGATYTPHCAALHPARLVRGLAASLEARGVQIYEQTTVLGIEPHTARTTVGDVRAEVVVRATEGFTPQLQGAARDVAPVYSLMIATEVLPGELWNTLGLRRRQTFTDARHMVIYGQRTHDDRLAFGGRGAPYHFGSNVQPRFDRDPRVHHALEETIIELFPQLAGTAITHRWGGPLGIARDWWCSVRFDRRSGLASAGGYVGDGVATTNLAGRTLADLITGRDSELTDLAWVGHRSRRWEPEPLRWLAINGSLQLPSGADRYEHKHRRPERVRSAILRRLLGH